MLAFVTQCSFKEYIIVKLIEPLDVHDHSLSAKVEGLCVL